MKLDFIPMDKLSIAATNMRGKGKDPDVSDLLPSIRARGVIVPLLVRPGPVPSSVEGCAEGHFEIVAGRRRFTAVNAVAREGGAVKPVPCAILDEGDDADALEASMLENLARVQPDEVRQWEAFVELVKSGRSVDEVADTFGFEPSAVKRILVLGNLLPRIRTLYRGGQIDVNTVRHLTLASKSQQKAWLALFDDGAAYCPTGHQLKAWLFGGSAIAVTHALFDVADTKLAIVSDLFGEDSFFANSDAFWSAQMSDDTIAPMASPDPVLAIAEADALIAASGARVQIGGGEASYSPSHDFVQVPPQAAFHEPINWYRTALHELGHWTGHRSRLDRDQQGRFGSESYAKEELVAEMAAAFTCASLGIAPTVRHSDYIGAWLSVLRGDEKAIFRAASQASKASDYLLAFAGEGQ